MPKRKWVEDFQEVDQEGTLVEVDQVDLQEAFLVDQDDQAE